MTKLITAEEARAKSEAAREAIRSAAREAGYSVIWNEHWHCFQFEPHAEENDKAPHGRRPIWLP